MKKKVPDGLTLQQWEAMIEGLDSHPTTVNDYRKVLNLLHKWENGQHLIQNMSREDAAAYFSFLDEREQSGDLSTNTVHRYKATLRSLGLRIQMRQDLFPGYRNPFSRLVKNEIRSRTSYKMDMFADPEKIRQFLEAVPAFSGEEAVIVRMMAGLGISPLMINNMRISDFKTQKDGRLTLTLDMGTIIEKQAGIWKQSEWYTAGYPVTYIRTSSADSVTWKYTGAVSFEEDFAAQLKNYYKLTGKSRDSRRYFLTVRHKDFTYRAMHHMFNSICTKAGLDIYAVTPYQLTRYGMIISWLQHYGKIDTEPVGRWDSFFPLPHEVQVRSVIEQLGEDALYQITGTKKKD
ncbi:MAG: hypothetical protein K6D03_00980 [Solobacterium sp.]|nr:hypothetical protein [Solobacterium sp.]